MVVAAADRRAAEALAVPPTARLLRLRRLEAGNGRPVGLEVYLVPLDRFPGLDTVDLDQVSLIATLRDRFGCAVRTVSEIYTAGLLGPVEAELLDGHANEPVVQLEQVATDDRGPVTYLRGLYPGDRCRLSVVRRLA